MKKQIVFIHLLNDFSGSPKVLSQVIRASKQTHDIKLFTGRSQEGFLTDLIQDHYEYFYKWYSNKYLTLASFFLSQVSLFIKILNRRNTFDTLYINTMLPFGAAIAGKLFGKEIIYHIHETYIKPKIFKKFLRWFVQRTASKIIFVSETLREKECFSKDDQRVIYNALEDDFRNQSKGHLESSNSSKKFGVLMLCSLKAYKGIEEFILIAGLCEKSNMEFTLVLNSEEEEVKKYFSTYKLHSNIILLGKQKDVHPFYKKADIVLNLSKPDKCIETFGLTIIEAMAYGIPVIVPTVGGPAEIVRNGVEGFLISSYEPDRIANKIIELSHNKEIYNELSKNALKRAKAFDEKTFQKEILAIINE